jgi:hypothetical protein
VPERKGNAWRRVYRAEPGKDKRKVLGRSFLEKAAAGNQFPKGCEKMKEGMGEPVSHSCNSVF